MCHDLQRCLRDTLDAGFDFLVTPLAHPRHRRPAPSARDPSSPQPAPFARSDLLLNSSQWSSQVVGKTSPWIDPDAASRPLRRDSEAALRQELAWAAHLSLHAVLLPPPALKAANYARLVNQFLGALSHTALWVRVPVVAPEVESAEARDADSRAQSACTQTPPRGTRRLDGRRGVGGRHARGCRRSHPPTRPRPVRALGESPSVVRGPLATRRVPGDWRDAPARRRARSMGGRTRSRGRRLPARVRVQQAGISRASQAPPRVLTLMMRRNVQIIIRGATGDGDGDGDGDGTERRRQPRRRPPPPPQRTRPRRRHTRRDDNGNTSSISSARSNLSPIRSSRRLAIATTSKRRFSP